jgi:hypothetical protein
MKLLSLNKISHFEFWLLGIYLLLGLMGILNHSMWRDELNGWLIARDSLSWGEFWQNIRYEGHPLIWYLCLSVLTKISLSPLVMQIFHWLITSVALGLFIFKAPFSRLQKILFTFGYLPLYEYLLISRNYGLGLLALTVFCTLFPGRRFSYIPLALTLAFLANSNAYGLLISLALAFTLGLEFYTEKYLFKVNKADIFFSLGIFIAALILAVIMLLPPADSTLQGGANQWFLQWDPYRLNQTLSRIWNSYILILVPSDAKFGDVTIFAIFSIMGLIFWSLYLSDYAIVSAFYLTATTLILSFTYFKFLGSARHYGHLYLILIVALWLKSYYVASSPWMSRLLYPNKKLLTLKAWVDRQGQWLLTLILVCQLIAGLIAYGRDLTLPYSASRAVAQYLQVNQLATHTLVGSEDFAVSPISGYLGQPIYYPETKGLGSFVLFNHQRQPVTLEEALEIIANNIIVGKFSEPVIFISNRLINNPHPLLTTNLLAQFDRSFIGNEKYFLYRITLDRAQMSILCIPPPA